VYVQENEDKTLHTSTSTRAHGLNSASAYRCHLVGGGNAHYNNDSDYDDSMQDKNLMSFLCNGARPVTVGGLDNSRLIT